MLYPKYTCFVDVTDDFIIVANLVHWFYICFSQLIYSSSLYCEQVSHFCSWLNQSKHIFHVILLSLVFQFIEMFSIWWIFHVCIFETLKEKKDPWLVWLSGLSTGLRTRGLPVWFPVRAHAWVAGQVPRRGHSRRNHTLVFLSPSFSFFSPLSK